MLRFDVLTLFPAMFDSLTQLGVTGRAFQQQLWQCQTWNPRDYALDAHKTVDDRPYGGGPGMVMMVEPLEKALCDAQAHRQQTGLPAAKVYLTSPRGERFTQKTAHAWNHQEGAILICGRYEGVDQRFIDQHVDAEISLGDFVLSGGEFAALAMMDACVRLVPGVLNDHQSALQDSFEESLSGLLDCPHYTRPENYNGFSIPDVLLSGHHAKIALWRRQESLRLTFEKRPDLILEARRLGQLSSLDERFLANLG